MSARLARRRISSRVVFALAISAPGPVAQEETGWPPRVDHASLAESVRAEIGRAEEAAHAAPEDAEVVGELGMVYFGNKLSSAAACCFERSADLDPSDWSWRYFAGISRKKANEIEAAIDAFERVLRAAADYAPARVELGGLLLESDPDRAHELFLEAVRLDETSAPAHEGLGRCAVMRGDEEAALAHYGKALELEPDSATAHYQLAMLHRDAGRLEEATHHMRCFRTGGKKLLSVDELRHQLRQRMSQSSNLRDRVTSLWAARDFEEAARVLAAELETNPDPDAVRDLLGHTYLRSGRFAEAAAEFRRILADHPNYVEPRSSLSLALQGMGRLDEAEDVLRGALATNSESGTILRDLAVLLTRRGRPEEAAETFERAIAVQPGQVDLRLALARLRIGMGEDGAAVRGLRAALEVDPGNTDARFLLGTVLYRVGATGSASEEMAHVIRLDPGFVRAYLELSAARLRAFEYGEAVRCLEQGLENAPGALQVAGRLALILAACPEAALRDGDRALELAEGVCRKTEFQNPQFLDTLAAAQAELGRFDEAAATARRAVELARGSGKGGLARDIGRRLSLFESARPYRLPGR